MATLLFEIGTEEIPARFMEPALRYMESFISERLRESRIDFEKVKATGTPRRLVLFVEGVAERQRDLEEEIIGPPAKVAFDATGKTTKAGEGFARAQGVSVEELKIKQTPKGEYVYIVKREEGKPTKEILPEILKEMVLKFPWPKSMRWGKRKIRFARPIHWFLALLDNEVIKFQISDIESGNITYGHRFLAPQPITVNHPKEYPQLMEKAYVIFDHEKRKEIIKRQIQEEASKVQGRADEDPDLLHEVTFLVEYPVATVGKFDKRYLDLPQEVLTTTMKEHQRYFPVFNEKGEIMPYFVVVNNIITEDMDLITRGNERVLKARLADAKFFYDEDKKTPLIEMFERLKNVLFQEKLGTSYEKVMRFKKIAEKLAEQLVPEKREKVERCAILCKADLESQMVNEFDELQGIMGREYAYAQGEDPEVAEGIFEHYLPRFSGDKLPSTDTGAIVGIADRIDTIVGCFGIGLVPTGSEDPYGLRRDALGIIQVVLHKGYRISLSQLIDTALELLQDRIEQDPAKVKEDVLNFFRQRLYHLWVSEGYRYDIVDAVLEAGFDDIVDAKKRLEALSELSQQKEFEPLMTTFKRVVNIIPKGFDSLQVRTDLFEKDVEKELYEAVISIENRVESLINEGNYREALMVLASLKEKVDNFFDNVLVMDKDESKKNNRLALLNRIASLFGKIADLKKVVLQKQQ